VVDPKTLVPGSREAHFGVRAEVGHYIHKYMETRMYRDLSFNSIPLMYLKHTAPIYWCES